MPDKNFFAMGLDSKKRQIRAISSNPGHLIATAIAANDVVRVVGERLFQPDLFTGWGIRTLSWDADHPFPAFYLQANSPQSWSASSVFCHI